jgi:flagellar biosynthesis protein FliQ
MVESQIIQVTREGLYLILLISAPPILASLVIGMIISLFQAMTQVQEQTLTFAPKIVIVFGVLAILGPWIGSQLVRFTFSLFDQFPQFVP